MSTKICTRLVDPRDSPCRSKNDLMRVNTWFISASSSRELTSRGQNQLNPYLSGMSNQDLDDMRRLMAAAEAPLPPEPVI